MSIKKTKKVLKALPRPRLGFSKKEKDFVSFSTSNDITDCESFKWEFLAKTKRCSFARVSYTTLDLC